LAIELERQVEAKRDFMANTGEVTVATMDRSDTSLALEIPTEEEVEHFPIRPVALRQIGSKLKIPAKFIDRCEKYPDLIAGNINYLFKREPEKRLVRTLDGNVRGFLSDSYRRMDNYDVAKAVLPVLAEYGAQVTSCEVTERKLYIKAIRPDLVAEIPPPEGAVMGEGHTFFIDKVQAGLTINNSEIGFGRLSLQPSHFTKRCTNYASFTDYAFNKVHLGSKDDSSADIRELMSDQTKKVDDAALWMKVRDLVIGAMDGTIFDKIVDDLKASRGQQIEGNPVKCVELLSKRHGLTDDESGGVIEHLIKGGELTQYGLSNAVTRLSQDIEKYDRATELEVLGGKIIELKPTEWQVLAKAA